MLAVEFHFFCVERGWADVHMSPGSSSPRDLNIAPHAVTAVTPRLMVTFWPRLYKRDLKLTYPHQKLSTRAQKRTHLFRALNDPPAVQHAFPPPPAPLLPQRTVHVRVEAGGGRAQSDARTCLDSWSAGRGQSLAQLTGHLLVPRPRLDVAVLQAAAQPRVGGV